MPTPLDRPKISRHLKNFDLHFSRHRPARLRGNDGDGGQDDGGQDGGGGQDGESGGQEKQERPG